MEGVTLAHAYVHLRLTNPRMTGREAARQVGFAGGKPSPKARRLWDLLQFADEETLQAAQAEAAQLDAQVRARRQELERLQARKRELAPWLEAAALTT